MWGDLDRAAAARRTQPRAGSGGERSPRRPTPRPSLGSDAPTTKPGEGQVVRPDEPTAGLAAEGATTRVNVGSEGHHVAAKTTVEGDTSNELALDVETAATRFPDALGRLARPESPAVPGVIEGDFSRILPAGELGNLPRAQPGTDTVVLGPYSRRHELELPGGRQIVGHEDTLESRLQPAAALLGGRTLERFPGNIEALTPEIRNADRIVFFVTRGTLGPLTRREMELVQSSSQLRAKTVFVTGAIE